MHQVKPKILLQVQVDIRNHFKCTLLIYVYWLSKLQLKAVIVKMISKHLWCKKDTKVIVTECCVLECCDPQFLLCDTQIIFCTQGENPKGNTDDRCVHTCRHRHTQTHTHTVAHKHTHTLADIAQNITLNILENTSAGCPRITNRRLLSFLRLLSKSSKLSSKNLKFKKKNPISSRFSPGLANHC